MFGRLFGKGQNESKTQACVRLLDQIMLTDGIFDYKAAMQRLADMKNKQAIDVLEYMNLVDACNHRNDDGDYTQSLIYKRMAATQ